MAEDSNYILEPIREGADFTLYRGKERGNSMPILAVAVAAEQPSPQVSGGSNTNTRSQRNSMQHGRLGRSR